MNTLQKLGALFFEEQYSVPVRLSGNLATSAAAASAGSASFTAGSLVEALERMCLQRVAQALADSTQGVSPSQAALVHRAPALPGAQLFVRGWVQRVGWDAVSFELEVRDRFKLVCEGTVTLALSRALTVSQPAAVPDTMPARRSIANRPSAFLGFFSPAMAGRAMPVLLWAIASVPLFAVTFFAIGSGLEQQAARAALEPSTAIKSPALKDTGTPPQLTLPLPGSTQDIDTQTGYNKYGT